MQSTPNADLEWEPTDKQIEALIYLKDKKHTEVFFGGGAGGGKSWLGCMWLLSCAYEYPETSYVLARAELKALKQSTLLTLFRICLKFGLHKDEDYSYNSMNGEITFFEPNSHIYLRELKANPSDPEFDKLGSTEYTAGFIDEGSQTSYKGYTTLTSRLRYRLDEYGLVPKLLICSNPTKNFLHYEFFKPWREGKLAPYRAMVQALVKDNKHIDSQYIEQLKRLPKADRERLLHGNWDYEDDPTKLFEFDALTDIFTRPGKRWPEKFLISDIARFGKDNTTIFIFEGLRIIEANTYHGLATDETEAKIEEKRQQHNIARSHCCADEDGVGGGVIDHLKGIYGFINNSKAINPHEGDPTKKPPNYANLKSQCYFYLADAIVRGDIGCYTSIDPKLKQMLIEDLEQVKRMPTDDKPLAIIPKDEMKEKLGRSPDLADTLAMRMVFEIQKPKTVSIAGWVDRSISSRQKQDGEFMDFLYG
jgi:phage terminase large subunit